MKTLAFALFVFFLLLAPANAAPLSCVNLVSNQGRPTLINRCNECRIATLERKRPGDQVPITRHYTMPASAKVEGIYHGSGRARITDDRSCSEPTAESADANGVQSADGQNCIGLQATDSGMVAINSCNACRVAVVERLSRGSQTRATVSVGPRSYAAMSRDGALQARVVAEAACGG
ncbi:MAG: hypothetical protein ACPGNT_03975 [Rhodospirillales bacterium]